MRMTMMAMVVAAGGGCPARGTRLPAGATDRSAPVVEMAAVVDTVISEPITATGTLAAKEETPLSFKIGGVVQSVSVDVGDVVPAGRILATLVLSEIGSVVAKAQAGLDKADRDLARAERLYQDSVLARERLDDARTGREVARAELTAAEFNAQYAVIRAPARGTILRRMAEPGQVIGAGMPVALFAADPGGQVVRVGLVDRDLARLSLGDRGTVRVATHDQEFVARVSRIGSAASLGAGTFPVELALGQPVRLGRGLASGLIAQVTVIPAKQQRVRLVPIGALLEADGDSAWVVSLDPGQKAHRHRVRVGGLIGEWVTILGGLGGVTQVVTRGAPYLTDGDQARVAGGAP